MAKRFPYSFPYYPVTENRFQSTIAAVRAEITAVAAAADLDFIGDAGGAQSVTLGTQTLTFAGDDGVTITGSAQTATIAVDTLYTADFAFSDLTRAVTFTGTGTGESSTFALNTAIAGAGLVSDDGGMILVTEETTAAYDDVCGITIDPTNYQTQLIATSTGATIGVTIEAYSDLLRLHQYDAAGSFEIAIDSTNATINDQRAVAEGLKYSADYSATFVTRSLVDVGYVQTNTWFNTDLTFTDVARTNLFTGTTDSFSTTFAINQEVSGSTLVPKDGGVVLAHEETAGSYDDICGLIIDPDNYKVSLRNYSTGLTIYSDVIVNSDSVYIGASKTGGDYVELNINPDSGSFVISDNRTTATGIEYNGDYSADYTDRSLTDFGTVTNLGAHLTEYADDAAAGVGGLAAGDLFILTATKAITVKQ